MPAFKMQQFQKLHELTYLVQKKVVTKKGTLFTNEKNIFFKSGKTAKNTENYTNVVNYMQMNEVLQLHSG